MAKSQRTKTQIMIVPFRLDNVLLALYPFTSFAYHFGVFKISVVVFVLLDLWSSL
jgi:hypothetical protein